MDELDSFIEEQLKIINDATLKSYIFGIFKQNALSSEFDLSEQSIVMFFSNACKHNDFHTFQMTGDWIFWASVVTYEFIRKNEDVYKFIATSSYNKCNRILNGKWVIFDVLSSEFSSLTSQLRKNWCFQPNNRGMIDSCQQLNTTVIMSS